MAMSTIIGCIKKADSDYQLIQDGDRIAVGVSGGKDSMVLLYALKLYQRFSKKKYSFIGIHIEMGFPNMNFSEIEVFCKQQNIEFLSCPSSPNIYKVLNLNRDSSGKLPCSICSKMKKAAINQAAKINQCNKVAFAHHGDDAIETLLMNAIYGGRIATFAPTMYLDREKIIFIRPLIYAHEKEIIKAAKEAKLPLCLSTCENDKHTSREEMKNMLKDLYKKYPSARENFLTMLSNYEKINLWEKKESD